MNPKQWVKQSVVTAAATRGYQLVADWKFERQPLVRHLRRLFDLQRIDCVLDVGGNLGQYHDLLREDVGFKGWIVSFEPVAKYVAVLQERARTDPRWRVRDCALGRVAGTAEIHVTQSPGLNSFLAPRTDAHAEFWRHEAEARMETVQVRRLDDEYRALERELGFGSPYLKLDTQGFDLEVVKGAGETLLTMRALQTEASVIPIYEGMPTHLDTLAELMGRGFALSAMFPVNHDRDLRLVEYDCVLVNDRYGAR